MARPRKVPAAVSPSLNMGRVLIIAYRLALAAGIVMCVLCTVALIRMQKEFAQSADRFGYLQMAADMRKGEAPHGLPRFTFDGAQPRAMLGWMKQEGLPLDNAVAASPNAYHYSAAVDRFICQYPPGTAMMLRLLPEGSAVETWRLTGAVALALLGLMAVAGRKSRPLGMGVMTLAVMTGLTIIPVAVSYSVDFLLVPLAAVVICLLESRRPGRWGWILLGMGGLVLGWSSVVRLSAAFFLPGAMAAAWWLVEPSVAGGATWKKRLGRLGLLTGAFIVGLIPLLAHQKAMTGSWLKSTYTPVDDVAPSAGMVGANLRYYFWGEGNYLMIYLGVGAAVAAVWVAIHAKKIGWRKLGPELRVISLLFLGPTAYFLTHAVVTPYYQYLTIFVTLLAMGWWMLRMPAEELRGGTRLAGSLAALAVVVLVLFEVNGLPWPDAKMKAVFGMPDTTPPAGVEDPKAWVLADRLSGSLWHYNGIAAVRADALESTARWRFCEWLKARGEKVYFLEDNPEMALFKRQMQEKGVQFVPMGSYAQLRAEQKVAFCDVYRVEW